MPEIAIRPLTPARWADFEELFGPRGACAGCWCMWPRLPAAEFTRGKGAGNRRAMKRIVDDGAQPGLLAYAGREPVGWIALAPRAEYVRLARSRVLRPVDDRPVWSVVCFFVAKGHRRQGLTVKLLEAAAAWAKKRGARLLEGYPVEPRRGELPAAFAWTGLPGAFQAAGFTEVARRSPVRPILRREL